MNNQATTEENSQDKSYYAPFRKEQKFWKRIKMTFILVGEIGISAYLLMQGQYLFLLFSFFLYSIHLNVIHQNKQLIAMDIINRIRFLAIKNKLEISDEDIRKIERNIKENTYGGDWAKLEELLKDVYSS